MLPHGTRSAARPRVTREPTCTPTPTTVSAGRRRRRSCRAARRGARPAARPARRPAAPRRPCPRRAAAASLTDVRRRSPAKSANSGGMLAGEGEHGEGVDQHRDEQQLVAELAIRRPSRALLLVRVGGGRLAGARRGRRTPRANPSAPVRASPPTSTTVRPSARRRLRSGAPDQSRRRRMNSDSTGPRPCRSATSARTCRGPG